MSVKIKKPRLPSEIELIPHIIPNPNTSQKERDQEQAQIIKTLERLQSKRTAMEIAFQGVLGKLTRGSK